MRGGAPGPFPLARRPPRARPLVRVRTGGDSVSKWWQGQWSTRRSRSPRSTGPPPSRIRAARPVGDTFDCSRTEREPPTRTSARRRTRPPSVGLQVRVGRAAPPRVSLLGRAPGHTSRETTSATAERRGRLSDLRGPLARAASSRSSRCRSVPSRLYVSHIARPTLRQRELGAIGRDAQFAIATCLSWGRACPRLRAGSRAVQPRPPLRPGCERRAS